MIQGKLGAAAHVIVPVHTPESIHFAVSTSRPIGLGDFLAKALVDGWVLEFGVAGGDTLREIAGLNKARIVYGFDSFEGLPEEWRPGFPKGEFACSIPQDLPHNAELVIGLFEKTLPEWLALHPGPVAFVHIDCDLYSSTKCVLGHLAPRFISGTVLAFDEIVNYPEYEKHEAKAFAEFLNDTGFRYECLGGFGERAGFRLVR